MFKFLRSQISGGQSQKVTLEQTIQSVAKGEVTLVDVRDIKEVKQSGKAQGALHIPLMSVGFQTDPRHPDFRTELELGKPIAVYCASGARSGMAVRTMKKFGFQSVSNIGSLSQWIAAGGKVIR